MVLFLCYCDTAIQIKVLDHIIIGENRYFSFADAGLIEEYNSGFLILKEGKRTWARAELSLAIRAEEQLEDYTIRQKV